MKASWIAVLRRRYDLKNSKKTTSLNKSLSFFWLERIPSQVVRQRKTKMPDGILVFLGWGEVVLLALPPKCRTAEKFFVKNKRYSADGARANTR